MFLVKKLMYILIDKIRQPIIFSFHFLPTCRSVNFVNKLNTKVVNNSVRICINRRLMATTE